ncbi:unnamed protein product [Danaus chrysippus]|uniref:(African queen) hypothetical protein n=1 Tax=Danaus chrysippus TaxID=151541 RepID=A0A8J2MIG8_9NEOP|nr:unnamed protein product [Danaus chrysippus]
MRICASGKNGWVPVDKRRSAGAKSKGPVLENTLVRRQADTRLPAACGRYDRGRCTLVARGVCATLRLC